MNLRIGPEPLALEEGVAVGRSRLEALVRLDVADVAQHLVQEVLRLRVAGGHAGR